MKSYIVLDVESTCCDKNSIPREESEIIEIGAVFVHDGQIVNQFSKFIKPEIHTQLTDFCKKLTTIQQEDVDNAGSYKEAIKEFEQWIEINSRKYGKPLAWMSWGEYDKKMLKNNGEQHQLKSNQLFFNRMRHINVKNYFKDKYKRYNFKAGYAMESCAKYLKIDMQGTYHRGVDDAYNIAQICIKSNFDFNKKLEFSNKKYPNKKFHKKRKFTKQ